MVTSYTKPLMPYDIELGRQGEQVSRVGERLAKAPVDYARRGGGALRQRGDMYESLLGAASRASDRHKSAEQAKTLAWDEAGRRKQAIADRQQAQNISNLVTGLGGLAQDVVRRGVDVGTRDLSEADLGGRLKSLLADKSIREVVDESGRGTGKYRYTAGGGFREFHRGPYWWESPESTGGWTR